MQKPLFSESIDQTGIPTSSAITHCVALSKPHPSLDFFLSICNGRKSIHSTVFIEGPLCIELCAVTWESRNPSHQGFQCPER